MNRIGQVTGGRSARLQTTLVRIAAGLFRLWGGRGLGRAVALIGRPFGWTTLVDLEVPGGVLRTHLSDGYWMGPLLRGDYETEVAVVLRRVLDRDTCFIDCGANIGYWSVHASGLQHQAIIAVEAAPNVFAILQTNAELNDHSFKAIHAAVWSTSDSPILLAVSDQLHAWSSAAPSIRSELVARGFTECQVSTTTLDDLARDLPEGPVVVKLDLEGAELEALEGATSLLTRDPLFIFEEHVRDRSLATSRWLLRRGFTLFAAEGGLIVKLTEPEAIRELGSGQEGQNLVACRIGAPLHTRLIS